MREFSYTISDPIGIHARPAGLLVKLCREYNSTVTICGENKAVEATKLIALLGLGVKNGHTVTVQVEGSDEESACNSVEEFFKTNL